MSGTSSYVTGMELNKVDVVFQSINPLIYLNQSNASNIQVLFSNDVYLQQQINQLNYNISNLDSNQLLSNINNLSNLVTQIDIHTSNNSIDISNLYIGYSNNSNAISALNIQSSNYLTATSTNTVSNKTFDYNSNIWLNFPTNGGGTGGSNITSILNISNPWKFKASSTTPNQNILANNWTTVECSVEEFDSANSYNPLTYTYTILKEGYYYIDYSVVFLDSSVINNETYQARIWVNGTTQATRVSMTSVKTNQELMVAKANLDYYYVGDTIQLQAWSSIGSTLRSYNGTHFNAHLLSITTPIDEGKLYTIVNTSNQIAGNIPYWDGYSNQLNSNGYNYLNDLNNLNAGISNNLVYISALSLASSNYITADQTVELKNKTIDFNSNFCLNFPTGATSNYYYTSNNYTSNNITEIGTNIQNVYNPYWFRVFMNTSISNLTTGVWYNLELNTFEYEGESSGFNTSNYTFTTPVSGVYRFSYGVEFAGGVVNDLCHVQLLKNGDESELHKIQAVIKTGQTQDITLTDILELNQEILFNYKVK